MSKANKGLTAKTPLPQIHLCKCFLISIQNHVIKQLKQKSKRKMFLSIEKSLGIPALTSVSDNHRHKHTTTCERYAAVVYVYGDNTAT